MSRRWCEFSTQVETQFEQIRLNIGGRADQDQMIEEGEVILPRGNNGAQQSIVLTKFRTRAEHRVNIGRVDQVRWYSTSTRVRSAAEFLGETTVNTKHRSLNRPERIERLATMMSVFNIEPGEIIPAGTTLNDILKVDREEGNSFKSHRDVRHMEMGRKYGKKLAPEPRLTICAPAINDRRTEKDNKEGEMTNPLSMSLARETHSSSGEKRTTMVGRQVLRDTNSPGISKSLEEKTVTTDDIEVMSTDTSTQEEAAPKSSPHAETKCKSFENKNSSASDENDGNARAAVDKPDPNPSITSGESDDDKDAQTVIYETISTPTKPHAAEICTSPIRPASVGHEPLEEIAPPELKRITLIEETKNDATDNNPIIDGNLNVVDTQGYQTQMHNYENQLRSKENTVPRVIETRNDPNLKGILKCTQPLGTGSMETQEHPSSIGKALRRILKPTRMNSLHLMEEPGYIDKYFLTWEKLAIMKLLENQRIKEKTHESQCNVERCTDKQPHSKQVRKSNEDSSDSDNALAEGLPSDKEIDKPRRLHQPSRPLKSLHGQHERNQGKVSDDSDSGSDCAMAEDLPLDNDLPGCVANYANSKPGKQTVPTETCSSSENDSESDCAIAEDLPLDNEEPRQAANMKGTAAITRSKQQAGDKIIRHKKSVKTNSRRASEGKRNNTKPLSDSDDETFSGKYETRSLSDSGSDCNSVEDLPFDDDSDLSSKKQSKEPVSIGTKQEAVERGMRSKKSASYHSKRTAKVFQGSAVKPHLGRTEHASGGDSESDCDLAADLSFDDDGSDQKQCRIRQRTGVKTNRDQRPIKRKSGKRCPKDTGINRNAENPERTGLFSRKVSQNVNRLFGRDELSDYLQPPINPCHGLTVIDLRSNIPVTIYNHRKRKPIRRVCVSQKNEGGHRVQNEAEPEVFRTIGRCFSRSQNTPHQGRLSRIMSSIRGKVTDLKQRFCCGCMP